jgi:hypothetical protein
MSFLCHKYFVAKEKNIVKTIPLTVAITPGVYDTLVKFTLTQFSGKNAADTAARMILIGIDAATRGDSLLASAFKESSRRRR